MHDVIVVGGGIAGLTAAYQLRDKDVLVLDDRPVPGGRTESRTLGDYVYNAGAQVIMGDTNPVARLADTLNVQRTLISKTKVPLYIGNRVYAASSQPGLLAKLPLGITDKVRFAHSAWQLLRRYRTVVGQPFNPDDPRVVALTSCTMSELLGPMSADLKTVWNAIATISDGLDIDVTTPYHPLMVLLHFLEQEYAIIGGTNELTKALHRTLGERSQLSSPATHIEEHEDGVRVTVKRDGRQIQLEGRRCVMAMPAPVVLQLVKSLPQWKREALEHVEYASQTSAAFLLNKPSHHWLPKGVWRVPVAGQRACAITDPTFFYGDDYKRASGQGLLRIYTGDRCSKELIDMDRDSAISALIDDIEQIFPGIAKHIVDTDMAHWVYANTKWLPGHTRMFPLLQTPTQRIHFCGDYTSAGYMPGSVQSAYRVESELRNTD